MEETSTTPDIQSKLRQMRRSRGLSVQKLAEQMGENHQKVGRIERGNGNVTVEYLIKISKALGVSIDSLLADQTIPVKEEIKENPLLLNQIVLFVENHSDALHVGNHPEKKAQLVCSIYGQVSRFSGEDQSTFLDSIFHILLSLKK